MKNRFTENAEQALLEAEKSASALGHTYIGSEHLLIGLAATENGIAAKILSGKGLTRERLTEAVAEYSGIGSRSAPSGADMTPRARRIIRNSAEKTALDNASAIGTEHILLSLLEESEGVACRLILSLGVSVGELRSDLSAFLTSCGDIARAVSEKRASVLGSLSTLQNYGRDLTYLAAEGKLDPVIGRDTETERVIEILSRRTKNNPCLIGEPGVGKTAVVEGLSERIVKKDVPAALLNKHIVSLDLSAMIAGAKYRGEFEERLKSALEELRKNPDILLFIDEIHMISGAGAAEGAIDAANILKPALSRGELHLIGATTVDEYRKYIEKDSALERRFQPVLVHEPTVEETVAILRGLRPRYEAHHDIRITDEALTAAAELSRRYIHDRFLPDKAIDLIDEAAARCRIAAEKIPPDLYFLEEKMREISAEREKMIRMQDFDGAMRTREDERKLREAYRAKTALLEQKREESLPTLTREDVAAVLTAATGIPLYKLSEKNDNRLSEMEKELENAVYGQEHAIRAVSAAIRRSMAGLRYPERPIGSFLFLGSTGVGKTELAKAVAKALFDSEDALIRLDMSEYKEEQSLSKLIGSAPGYVGYEEGGKLTERVRKQPYSLLLFDEIEKAHPDIYNLLLQILEDGRLTDSHGRQVDFRNTVIVITSNLITDADKNRSLGFVASSSPKDESSRRPTEEKLLRHFRPEFLNRIDEIIVFNQISKETMDKIALSMLNTLRNKLAEGQIDFSYDDTLVRFLSDTAYAEKNGARPLRRLLVKYVENDLSTALLSGTYLPGDRIRAYMKDGHTALKKLRKKEKTSREIQEVT